MKKILCLCAALILALTTASAFAAADVTGAWDGAFASTDGQVTFDLDCALKQDGAKLTGTLAGKQGGDPVTIDDGKIEGDKVSFNTTYNGTVIHHAGTINAAGDEIKLVSTSSEGNFPGGTLTLTRSKAAGTPAAPAAAPASSAPAAAPASAPVAAPATPATP